VTDTQTKTPRRASRMLHHWAEQLLKIAIELDAVALELESIFLLGLAGHPARHFPGGRVVSRQGTGSEGAVVAASRVLLSDRKGHAVRQRGACVSQRSATDAQVVVLVVVRIMRKRSRLPFSSTFCHEPYRRRDPRVRE
jgi:hypothetical protein